MNQQSLQQCLQYIDSYWNQIIIKPKRFKIGQKFVEQVLFFSKENNESKLIIKVPYTSIVPNTSFYANVFYWDTYFMFRGILGTQNDWVVPSMVENFVYLFKKYHIIPNFTHSEALGRSQPPLLTSMILDAYNVIINSKRMATRIQKIILTPTQWLAERSLIALQEYEMVWQNETQYNHFVPAYQLNRYGNTDVGYAQDSEQESGWDMTSRFYNRCNQFLPVDLNAFLYKYEQDFSRVAQLLGNKTSSEKWTETAKARAERINTYMWNEKKGFYMDYDFVHEVQSEFMSLAGFVPLWAGIATIEQAKKARAKLKLFETEFGLTITDKASLPPQKVELSELPQPYRLTVKEAFLPKQWDYPNIWPPLEYLTVIGLLRYGFIEDAKRIMDKSLAAHVQAFEKYHALLEKMDGLTGDMPRAYWYPTQLGFGWTNAIFYRYTQLIEAIKHGTLYDPNEDTFPKTLQVIH